MRIARVRVAGGAERRSLSGRPSGARRGGLRHRPARRAGRPRAARGGCESEHELGDLTLLAPILPPTMRDFSVFEQHSRASVRNGRPRRPGARRLVRVAVLLLHQPARGQRTRRRDRGAARVRRARLRARGRGRHRPRRARPAPAGRRRAHRRLHDLQRLVREGSAVRGDAARTRHLQGQGLRQHARAVDRHRRRARAVPRRATGSTSRCAPTSTATPIGTDTLANMAWSFEELVSYASRGTWVRPGRRARLGHVRLGCLLELWGRHGRDDLPPLGAGRRRRPRTSRGSAR